MKDEHHNKKHEIMSKPIIAPSLLSANFARLGEEVAAIDKAGADWIHCDVMDGHFVPNLTFGPLIINAIRPCSKKTFDVHLMIAPADLYLEAFAKAGADIISVHAEAGPHIHRSIETIKKLGKKAGIAINPGTSASVLEPIINAVDLVVCMSVNPGFGGQSFIEATCETIKRVRAMRPDVDIEVDGGITPETAIMAAKAGANIFVAGSYVFKSGAAHYQKSIEAIRKAAESATGSWV